MLLDHRPVLCSAVQPHLLVKRSKWAHMLFLIKCTANLKFDFYSNVSAVTRLRSSARRANRVISLSKLDARVQLRCKKTATYALFQLELWWVMDESMTSVVRK